jgi:hypothetical protein
MLECIGAFDHVCNDVLFIAHYRPCKYITCMHFLHEIYICACICACISLYNTIYSELRDRIIIAAHALIEIIRLDLILMSEYAYTYLSA